MEVIRTPCKIRRAAKYLIHMERALMTKYELGSVYSDICLIYDPKLLFLIMLIMSLQRVYNELTLLTKWKLLRTISIVIFEFWTLNIFKLNLSFSSFFKRILFLSVLYMARKWLLIIKYKYIYLYEKYIFSLYCIISVRIEKGMRRRIEKQNIFIKTILHYI